MIDYVDSSEGVRADQLCGFFVGWPSPPSPEMHLQMLRNSQYVVLALDKPAGRVVGFISAISDCVLSAYIPFLEVLPEYQKQGIGRELVQRLLKRLEHLYMIDLVCDADVAPFYRALGMRATGAMSIRHYQNQAGCATG